MFPDARLLIAAIIASVVALSCGFGMFAAFRVNHEPLARLPSATAPLQLLASNSASLPLAVAAIESFDRRLPTGDSAAPEATAATASDHAADPGVAVVTGDRSRTERGIMRPH